MRATSSMSAAPMPPRRRPAFRGCRTRRRACSQPNSRRVASARRCRSPGIAATGVDDDLAPGADEQPASHGGAVVAPPRLSLIDLSSHATSQDHGCRSIEESSHRTCHRPLARPPARGPWLLGMRRGNGHLLGFCPAARRLTAPPLMRRIAVFESSTGEVVRCVLESQGQLRGDVFVRVDVPVQPVVRPWGHV